jgi:hypothetical protein
LPQLIMITSFTNNAGLTKNGRGIKKVGCRFKWVHQIHMNKHLIRFSLLRASESTRPFKY